MEWNAELRFGVPVTRCRCPGRVGDRRSRDVRLAQADPGHAALVELGEEISPRDEKWIVFRDLLRVFVGAGGELLRFAEEKNCLRWQIIHQSGE